MVDERAELQIKKARRSRLATLLMQMDKATRMEFLAQVAEEEEDEEEPENPVLAAHRAEMPSYLKAGREFCAGPNMGNVQKFKENGGDGGFLYAQTIAPEGTRAGVSGLGKMGAKMKFPSKVQCNLWPVVGGPRRKH